MSKHLVVFTMEGCPYCHDFKEMLSKEEIEFTDLDINDHPDEYDMFTKIVDNDLVPAFMVVNTEGGKTTFMAPDRDYEELDEALEKIKEIINPQ